MRIDPILRKIAISFPLFRGGFKKLIPCSFGKQEFYAENVFTEIVEDEDLISFKPSSHRHCLLLFEACYLYTLFTEIAESGYFFSQPNQFPVKPKEDLVRSLGMEADREFRIEKRALGQWIRHISLPSE